MQRHQPAILFFMHFPQDLDLLQPLIEKTQQQVGIDTKVVVLDTLLEESPRVVQRLSAIGVQPSGVSRPSVLGGLQPRLGQVKAIITASESTAAPHKLPHVLAQRANRLGIQTYTLQHGFENVGLNYFDARFSPSATFFASQHIFTWGTVDMLPPEVLPETRAKCIAVGCPKHIKLPEPMVQVPNRGESLVTIFENLHWDRYSDDFRRQFLVHLEKTALQFPNTSFLVKPHHAGLWLTKRYKGKLPDCENIVIADPRNPEWEPFTAPALIAISDAVITTPSTVALDAARAACPVAVA
ncbi:MAG: hypothetical protein F6K11_35105, partial [Leptolyngbya sp. SIO3F4]|nr:hypothetical protein [Leptolyngbya sp. SIO3F4]